MLRVLGKEAVKGNGWDPGFSNKLISGLRGDLGGLSLDYVGMRLRFPTDSCQQQSFLPGKQNWLFFPSPTLSLGSEALPITVKEPSTAELPAHSGAAAAPCSVRAGSGLWAEDVGPAGAALFVGG